MNGDGLFQGHGVEVKLFNMDDFLKVKETLMRIGVESRRGRVLYQSCHILHKRGRYSIMHFKELFLMDGKRSDICINDIERRNTIVNLLSDWKLISPIDDYFKYEPKAPMSQIKVIPFKDRNDWVLEAKYNIGKIK